MITLCGFALSNYFNKVKLALLEKGVDFECERVMTGSVKDSVLAASPLGLVPFIRTEHGPLCESQVILDYIEAVYPDPPLVPADPYGAAKVRELTAFVELHLELVARDIYAEAFFGGSVSDEVKARTHRRLVRHAEAFRRLAKFEPFVAGSTFTMADCAAWASLPLVGAASRRVHGEDVLEAAGIDWRGYIRTVEERPAARQMAEEQRAEQAALKPRSRL